MYILGERLLFERKEGNFFFFLEGNRDVDSLVIGSVLFIFIVSIVYFILGDYKGFRFKRFLIYVKYM